MSLKFFSYLLVTKLMFAILVRIGQSPSRGGKAVAMFEFVTFCHCAENVKLS